MTATTETQKLEVFPWWLVLIQGIVAVILGIMLVSAPLKTAIVLVQILGIYWIIDGVFSLVRIFLKNTDIHWGWLLARGILGIIAGIIVLDYPLFSPLMVGYVIAIIIGVYGIMGGIIGLIEAFQGGGWGAGILGTLSLVFGILILGNYWAAAMVLPWVIGIWGIVGGIMAIVVAFKIK